MNEPLAKRTKEIKCYASALGNCSHIQSEEHYISRSFFSNNMITVEGQKWLNGKTKTVSYKKVGLKILCEYHNNLLHPIDTAIAGVGRKIDALLEKQIKRSHLPRGIPWKKDIYEINGFVFEQWMIKAVVGCMFENENLRWHQDNSNASSPPIEILQAQFGLTKLKYPMGLYQVMGVGEQFQNEQRAGIVHLSHIETKGVVGALVNFRNLQFLMYLHNEPDLGIFESWNGTTFGTGYNEPVYRPTEFTFATKGMISSILKFDWQSSPINLP